MHIWTSMLVAKLYLQVDMVCYRKSCALASEQGWLRHYLVDEIKHILDVVTSFDLEVDTQSLAEDIANYERSLARVRWQCIDVSLSFVKYLQEWLTNTELRNFTAIYNPMTLQELSDLFNLVTLMQHMYMYTHTCMQTNK